MNQGFGNVKIAEALNLSKSLTAFAAAACKPFVGKPRKGGSTILRHGLHLDVIAHHSNRISFDLDPV